MAPTICSEKKQQIRPVIKDIHRQPTTVVTANSSTFKSAIIGYVAKGSLNARKAASLRVRGVSTQNSGANVDKSSVQLHTERLQASGPNTNTNSSQPEQKQGKLQLISDSAVSSSTHRDGDRNRTDADPRNAAMPSSSFAHYSSRYQNSATDADMYAVIDTDDDDAEVHSIISGKWSAATLSNLATPRQLRRCAIKTVFAAHSHTHNGNNNNNQQPAVTGRSTANNHVDINNGKSSSSTCKSSCGSHSSDTYMNMCEIKSTEGLLAIALQTIKLVKRNQLLQRRLAQLQLETSEFIQSVLANPENRHFREKVQPRSATMEKLEWKGGRNVAEV